MPKPDQAIRGTSNAARPMRPMCLVSRAMPHRPKNVAAAASRPTAAMQVEKARAATRRRHAPIRPPAPEQSVVRAYVALGANLGDAAAALRRAVQAINSLPRTQ